MFKKSLVAVALVGAVGMAQAADVQVYGAMDAGFTHERVKFSGNFMKIGDSVKEHSTKLATGKHTGNRFGIKGTEAIDQNLKAGFVLEGGFDLLNGDMASKGKLFNRQADLFIEGDFGHLAFGRVGSLVSANGTYGVFGGIADNFGGGWGEHTGAFKHAFSVNGRLDNAVTYVSPEIAGAKLFAQYSFAIEGKQEDKRKSNDRYAAIGASYQLDKLALVTVFDKTFYKDGIIVYDVYEDVAHKKPRVSPDAWTLNFGGSYDFDVTKVYAAYQHAEHTKGLAGTSAKDLFEGAKDMAEEKKLFNLERLEMTVDQARGIKGNSFLIGADTPVLGGTLKLQAGYAKSKFNQAYSGSHLKGLQVKTTDWSLAAGYEYNLSKRTQVYAGAAYDRTKIKPGFDSFSMKVKDKDVELKNISGQFKIHNYEFMMGLVHKF